MSMMDVVVGAVAVVVGVGIAIFVILIAANVVLWLKLRSSIPQERPDTYEHLPKHA